MDDMSVITPELAIASPWAGSKIMYGLNSINNAMLLKVEVCRF